MIGKTISHYKILEKLGEGGMGVVYKAEDTKLQRDVAIKFLPRQVSASDEERERFKIEAQAAAALNHPNIATIHNIEQVDDEMFIVMEYIDGEELKDKIEKAPMELSPCFWRGYFLSIGVISGGFSMANEEHLKILKQGVEAWNEWRKKNPQRTPDLSKANLIEANLTRANLIEADLSVADLSKANLIVANLTGANLTGANLSKANLSEADLTVALLTRANLTGANLYKADLSVSDLIQANLTGANLSEADLYVANLSKADLTGAQDLTAKQLITTINWQGALLDSSLRVEAEKLIGQKNR